MSVHDVMAECFDEVANISAEIDSESMLELRNEVREAHNETSQIKKEAETTNMYLTEMKEQLSLASDQLTLVNGQLEHTKQLNANLQKKLDGA
jgi:predicted  nucleic acid-binding Zn-ribbon protein